MNGGNKLALRLLTAAAALATATSCGGDLVPADPAATDAGDAATSGECHMGKNAECTGDPGCCAPWQSMLVDPNLDLTKGCGDVVAHLVGCFSASACLEPSSGELGCYETRSPSGTTTYVVSADHLLSAATTTFTRCDAATTKSALAVYAKCHL